MNVDKIRVEVLGITYSNVQQGAYVLLLAEEGGSRRIPIVVGTAEAQAIAIQMEKLTPPRPMTHDLMVSIMKHYDVQSQEVNIYRFENGIFYSTLTLSRDGHIEVIDSRTSDAIALALRTQAPIYIAASVVQQTAFEASQIEKKENTDNVSSVAHDNLDEMTDAELQARIERAVAVEAYEEAAMIQQILQKRKL